MPDLDLERAEREEIRWRILKVLDAGRPRAVSEALVLRILHDTALPATPHGLRRELDYLRDRGLVKMIGDDHEPTWVAELTRLGVDVVEYTVPCEPGIARPKKWY